MKKLKILMLNNYYYMRGGSERVFFGDMHLMESKAHEVVPFSRKHPENIESPYSKYFPNNIQTDKVSISIDGIRTVKELISSAECKSGLNKLLSQYKPDIVHAHNIYGRLTSSTIKYLWSRDLPIVMTLHDYKLICPSYKMEVKGEICEKCEGKMFYQAVINRCVKDSVIASSVYAVESYFNNATGRYKKYIDILISPSQFLKDKLVEYGWDPEKIKVVRNVVNLDEFVPTYRYGDYLLYIGRLSREKGIVTLINAYKALNTRKRLLIAGGGPLERELKELAKDCAEIEFTGHLDNAELFKLINDSMAVVVPSEWYENAPMSVLEAMACGKPVLGARIGGIPEMVQENVTGFLFESGNVEGLSRCLDYITNKMSNEEIVTMGKTARKLVETNHSQENHYNQLMSVYEDALKLRHKNSDRINS